MQEIKQSIPDLLAFTLDTLGKTFTVCAITLKLADVNNVITWVMSIIGVIYLSLKTYNELLTILERRGNRKNKL